MGGGGASGDVQFPDYTMDVHGDLIAGSVTDDVGDFSETFDRIDRSVVQMLNTAINTNPWSGFTITNPSGAFNNVETRRDAFVSAVTGYGQDKMSTYVTNALLAVSGVSSSDVPNVPDVSIAANTLTDAQTLFQAHVDTLIGKLPAIMAAASSTSKNATAIDNLIQSAVTTSKAQANFTAATTAWKTLVGSITSVLNDCDLPREIKLQSILVKAAQDADNNLRSAIEVTKRYIDGTLLDELVTQFAKRRETGFQRQISQFAGQMADVNAVNSSAFMFGTALIRSEQMREVSEFDAQLSLSMLREGLSAYVQMHAQALSAGITAEESNSRHHTAIVNASLDLMGTLQDRGEIKPADLIGAYSNMFQSEVQGQIGVVEGLMRHMGFIRQDNLNATETRAIREAEFQLRADEINKAAKEERYRRGLQMIAAITSDRVEFERALATFELQYRDTRSNAINVYEEKTQQYAVTEDLWQLESARRAGDILAAPAGMTAAIPNRPGIGREVVSLGLQTGAKILAAKAGGA